MKPRFVHIALMLVLASSVAGDWPMFGHDLAHTGFINISQTSRYSGINLTLSWSFKTNNSIRASPVAADLDGDKNLEVVFPSGNTVYALKPNGSLLWSYTVNATIHSTPSLGDLNVDNDKEIVFGADNGVLYALRHDGSLLWYFPTGGSITASPALADLNEDGTLEVFFGSWDGNFYAVEYNGKEIWRYPTGSRVESSPAIADIDLDKRSEIIFGCDNNLLYVLSSPPYRVWMYQTNGNILSSPTTVDLNRDSKMEVIFGTEDGLLYALHYAVYSAGAEGEISKLDALWNYTSDGAITTTASVADLDGDSNLEVVFGSDDKMLYILNYTGGRLVRYTVSRPIRSSPILADLNSDFHPEVIFGSDDKTVYIINYTGSTLWSFKTEGIVRSTPIAVVLEDGGGIGVVVGSDAGVLYVFQNVLDYEKSVADGFYAKAEEYYLLNDIASSRRYALKAKDIYFNISYFDGVSNVNRLLDRLAAKEFCNRAEESYAMGDLKIAMDFALESDKIYFGLNLGNESLCSNLLSKTNADLYYIEAEFFYDNEQYNESLVYASEAKKLYKNLNNRHGLEKVDVLLNKTLVGSTANGFYMKAQEYSNRGAYLTATNYNIEAIGLYSQVGHSRGLNNSLNLGKRINASLNLVRANTYYNQSMLMDANFFALGAYELYVELNDSTGVEAAVEILNKTQDYVYGREMLKLAGDFYYNNSFDSASYYANVAIRRCSETNDGECVQAARSILDNIEGQPAAKMPLIRAFILAFTGLILIAAALYILRRVGRGQKT